MVATDAAGNRSKERTGTVFISGCEIIS
jgi:hypothetical protein